MGSGPGRSIMVIKEIVLFKKVNVIGIKKDKPFQKITYFAGKEKGIILPTNTHKNATLEKTFYRTFKTKAPVNAQSHPV